MLTMFKRLASLIPTPATNKVTLFVSDTGIPSYKDDAGLVTPMSGQPIPTGYIDGLKMEWVSGTQIRFTSGSAYIPSLGRALALAAAVTKTPTLAANTWYHNYVYDNAGTTDVEVSTTVPAAPYNGTARTKTGDTSRRYIGSFRTDASGAILNFQQEGGRIIYQGFLNQAPFTVLSNGSSTTETTVSLTAVVPPTARVGMLRHTNGSTATSSRMNNSSAVFPNYVMNFGTGADAFIDFVVNANQSVSYWCGGAPSPSGVYIQVLGYVLER
ncbi:hypothetical protein [Stenotrophomonas sp. AR029]|uniref:hypothetical protein n=1 Tax=Stenotrophomonas sp. AR029 TaxID=3398601 RepID=UPI0039C726DA